jgi:hypothetical protein
MKGDSVLEEGVRRAVRDVGLLCILQKSPG